jgi:hypothetical protein
MTIRTKNRLAYLESKDYKIDEEQSDEEEDLADKHMSIRQAAIASGFVDEEQGGSVLEPEENQKKQLQANMDFGLFENLDQNINDYNIHKDNAGTIKVKIGTVYKKSKSGN